MQSQTLLLFGNFPRTLNRSAVAQISNLLYRRFPIGKRWDNQSAFGSSSTRQVENLRYSRLEICATAQPRRKSVRQFIGSTLERFDRGILTALSRGERVKRIQSPDHSDGANFSERRVTILPLPWGEGGGEGELSCRISN